MKNKTKIWLIIATALILVGLIIFGGTMAVLKWDFLKLSTVKYETNTQLVSQEFKDISIETDTADIRFVLSDDGQNKAICFEEKNIKHSVVVENGALKIKAVNTRKWYQHIGIALGEPKITVYLSKPEYGSLSIKTSTGDIEIPENFKFHSIDISESTGDVTNKASASGEIKIKTSTGDIYIDNTSASKLDLAVSTGDITLKSVIATEKFSINMNTGDLKFDKCDAAEIFVKTSTGGIKGSLLTEKEFITKTDTGDVDVPKTASGGKCEFYTDTGDIKISIQ